MKGKDYVKIAEAIKDSVMDSHLYQRLYLNQKTKSPFISHHDLVNRLCYLFLTDNPNFNESQFREACQPNNKP